ncbi:MAG: xanthine dehydrogenase family protein subunit M [Betaproteobacteria bacterium]|nr:xanthine dehydrogenase family protein subunit M [Betaproteobacteria bacterium]
MKPPPFKYLAARTLDEAIDALACSDGEAKVLAGGQSLVPMLNFRLLEPAWLVDINRIPGLDGIQDAAGSLHIGALTRHKTTENAPLIADAFPIVTAAMSHVAHFGVRNRGTIGGSLAHADPAAELPMLAMLLDASITTQSGKGKRTIAAKDFFRGSLATALEPTEILTAVTLPKLPPATGWSFEEISRRPGDFAVAAVAVTITQQGGRCTDARIALAGVGATPIRFPQAERTLIGQTIDAAMANAAAAIVRDQCEPQSDLQGSADYRRHLVGHLVARGIDVAAGARS